MATARPAPAAPSTVLPGGRAAVCHAVMDWLADDAAPRALVVTGPAGSGKTFTLAWAASELAVLAESADDERFAWVSARGLTPRVLAWLLAGQLGVTVGAARELGPALGARLRGSGAAAGSGVGSGLGPGVAAAGIAGGFVGDGSAGAGPAAGGARTVGARTVGAGMVGAGQGFGSGGAGPAAGHDGSAAAGQAVGGSLGTAGGTPERGDAGGAEGDGLADAGHAAGGSLATAGDVPGPRKPGDAASDGPGAEQPVGGSAGAAIAGGALDGGGALADVGQALAVADGSSAELRFAAWADLPASRSATWDLLGSTAAATYEAGRWSRVTILISELDLAGHLRNGSARAAVVSELVGPLLAVPGVRVIVESREADLPGTCAVIDLGEPRWTDKAEFAAWLDDLVPSGGAAAPQAYPNPTKAREILSLAAQRHAGLLAASDERPWKLAAVPFDVAFREGIADQIVLEPANLVLVQQPALSTAIDALGTAVAPGTRAAWRVAGQALTNAGSVPERAAVLHGAALAVGDHALAEAVAPYTYGTRPSDGAVIGEPTRWLTRWAGWRPLPPDTPRPMPWPGPVAALAVMVPETVPEPVPEAERAEQGPGNAAVEDDERAAEAAEDGQLAGAEDGQAAGAAGVDGASEAEGESGAEVTSEAADPAEAPTVPEPSNTSEPEVLLAIDDLARAYRLDPRDGRILARPAAPVMVKARTAAIVDAAPSLVLTDASRRLAALGPKAPRGAVAAVRDVLPDTAVTAVAVAGEALVFGAADGRVHVWDTVTEELIADPEDQHSGAVTAVAAIWMPDVEILFALSGGLDGTFRLWAVPADASLLPVEDRGVPVTAVTAALTDVGPVAAVAWADGQVTVWDLDEARTGRPIPLGWAPKALALGSDGLLVAAGEDGLVAIDVHLADFFEA